MGLDQEKSRNQLTFELKEARQRIVSLERQVGTGAHGRDQGTQPHEHPRGGDIPDHQADDERTRVESEEELVLNSLMEHVIYQDTEMKVLWANRAACESAGLAFEDLVGRHCFEVWPERSDPCLDCPILKSRTTFQPEELEKSTPDGRFWSIRGYPVIDDQGVITGSVEITLDITERKRAEEALQKLTRQLEQRVMERTAELMKSDAKYRSLTENTLDIPCSIEPSGMIQYIGPQIQRYGFDPAKLKGRRFQDIVVPADREALVAEFQRARITGDVAPSEFRLQSSDHGVSWFEGLCAIETDLTGAIVGFTGVIRDVTARKNAEMINAQQQKRLRKLASKLASAQDREQQRIAQGLHDEVAQLLTAGSVKLALAQSSAGNGLVEGLLQDIGSLIAEANEKVHLLSFELSSSTLYRLGLHAAIKELCEGMSMRYGGRFHVQVEGDTHELDESTAIVLFKAVRELLFNVVKHAGVRQATVTISRDDSMLRLEVEDQGAGFPDHLRNGRYESGIGLGLFGIQERLRDLGGTMRIDSEPDVCTRVILWAPFGGEP